MFIRPTAAELGFFQRRPDLDHFQFDDTGLADQEGAQAVLPVGSANPDFTVINACAVTNEKWQEHGLNRGVSSLICAHKASQAEARKEGRKEDDSGSSNYMPYQFHRY